MPSASGGPGRPRAASGQNRAGIATVDSAERDRRARAPPAAYHLLIFPSGCSKPWLVHLKQQYWVPAGVTATACEVSA